VEYWASVLDEIRAAAVAGYCQFPRGGVEIGGILFGRLESGATRIVATMICPAWSLALTRDETQLYATCPYDVGRLEIIDIAAGRVVIEHRSLGGITRVAFSPDGATAAGGSNSGLVLVR
jgi:hypothetical protein